MFPNLQIQIVNTEIIEGGVAVFARAWTNGIQIGFGQNGTIDIERFRFFNPPVLVFDEINGDIIRSYTDILGVVKTEKLKQDPEAAMLIELDFVINKTGKLGTQIIPDSIGNTVSTFYPVAGATSPVDGSSARTGQGSWALARDSATGTSANATDTVVYVAGENEGGGTYGVYRTFTCFDTAAIGSDAISSATASIYGAGGTGSQSVGITQSALTGTANIITGDFDGITLNSAPEGATRQSYNGAAYNDFALNATGLGWINKTGITQFAFRDEKDIDNVTPPGSPRQFKGFYMADEAGTSKDPKLVVTHASGFTASPLMHMMARAGGIMAFIGVLLNTLFK